MMHIDSFYHLAQKLPGEILCQGTACFVARHLNPGRWRESSLQSPRVHHIGKCYIAPSSSIDEIHPRVEVHAPEAVVLANIVEGGARKLDIYRSRGGYTGLEKALKESAEDIVRNVEVSGLRGRGGAGFPTGKKWRAVFRSRSDEKLVIVNADEGDPGAYIDRFIIEDDPHRLIEAMAIAAYAVSARKGYIYLRGEYSNAYPVLQEAMSDARGEGFIGDGILNTDFSFDIEVVSGKGSYVCGEETVLIRSIEGKRPEVMPRPPYPTEHGLFGKPTLVNNVETLSNIPWIILHGGDTYRSLGVSNSRGTKVVSLNSLFHRPGLYEVEFGFPIRNIVEELGGGLKTGEIRGLIVGGPLAGVIPPELFDTPLGFEELRAIGASVGHGGVIAFDEHTPILNLIHHVFSFGAYESCGKCTPCRLGSRRIEEIFDGILQREIAPVEEKNEWDEIVSALISTSLCGLGTGLGEFARSITRYYSRELEACFARE